MFIQIGPDKFVNLAQVAYIEQQQNQGKFSYLFYGDGPYLLGSVTEGDEYAENARLALGRYGIVGHLGSKPRDLLE